MDIFGSALRLTYTGSYRIIQRCFSERTSRLRVYFKNVQLRLFVCLVWSSGDVSQVYESFGRETSDFKHWGAFVWDPLVFFLFRDSLGLSSLSRRVSPSLTISSPTSLVSLSLHIVVPPHRRRRSTTHRRPTPPTCRGDSKEHPRTTPAPPQWPKMAPLRRKAPLSRFG